MTEQLRQDILSNVHPGGTQLRQEALAASYGVSRIPVREALIQLESEGLVDLVPHKGAVVTRLSATDINDVFELRMLLESRLLAASIPRLDTQDFAQLDDLQAQFEQALARDDLAQYGLLNTQLHTTLYARAELPQTATLVGSLLQKSDRYTRIQLSAARATERARKEHDRLIKWARKRDIEAACALLRSHIDAVRCDLIALLKVHHSA